MKILTGRGQFSLPPPTKTNTTHLAPIDEFSNNFLSNLARLVLSKKGVNLSTSKGSLIMAAYFPNRGDPGFETRLREVNSILGKDPSSLILIFSDLGGVEDSGITPPKVSLVPPYKRSANQSVVDTFRGFGLKDPSRVLFFTWEVAPTEEQISGLASLASIKVKTLLLSIENSTMIESIKSK